MIDGMEGVMGDVFDAQDGVTGDVFDETESVTGEVFDELAGVMGKVSDEMAGVTRSCLEMDVTGESPVKHHRQITHSIKMIIKRDCFP